MVIPYHPPSTHTHTHTHTVKYTQSVTIFCLQVLYLNLPVVLFVMDLHYTVAIDMDVFFFYCTVLVSSIVAPVQSFVEKQATLVQALRAPGC